MDSGSWRTGHGYSTVVMGWILKYTIGTFTGAVLAPADIDGFAGAFSAQWPFLRNVNFWQTAALVICMIILMFGVGSGIGESQQDHDACFL